MIQLWEAASRKVVQSDSSLSFYYAKGHYAFRIEAVKGDIVPKLVIYAGANDPRRGSPLVKRANSKDVQKLETDFGISEDKDGNSRWLNL